jgi:hypothetical protein
VISATGGYNFKPNSERYARRKKSMDNLPVVGQVSTRTLVATGHFLDSIDVLKLEQLIDGLTMEVGPKNYFRPHAKIPLSGDHADLTGNFINNQQLAKLLDDKGYKIWAQEFEDVRKDSEVLALRLIIETVKELAEQFATKV